MLERRAEERFGKYRKNTALGFCVAHLGVARLEAVGGSRAPPPKIWVFGNKAANIFVAFFFGAQSDVR